VNFSPDEVQIRKVKLIRFYVENAQELYAFGNLLDATLNIMRRTIRKSSKPSHVVRIRSFNLQPSRPRSSVARHRLGAMKLFMTPEAVCDSAF